MSRCPSCGHQVAEEDRFCSSCGRRLDSGDEGAPRPSTALPSGERKWVTVLFADLVGSTSLIDGLDAEQADQLLQSAVGAMREAVHLFGGVVNGLQGDGIMALFGAPVAHEDHAVRACYAALEIPGLVSRATGGQGQVRVGLHSGEVIVRSVQGDLSADYIATGSTVHLAARMEQAATPGIPLVTAATVRLAEGFVDVRPRETVAAKGFDIPVAVFDLVGRTEARGSWDARRRRELTRFVGRAAELERLVGAAEMAASAGIGRMIGVEGEPGVGKSRLLHEFLSRRPARTTVIRAQTSPYDVHTSYLPIRQLLDAWVSPPGSGQDPVETIRQRLAGIGPRLDEAAPALAFVVDPALVPEIGDMDAAHRRRFVRDAIRVVLERASIRQPLILVVEDLHWVDNDSRVVLEDLLESVGRHPMVVVVTYRPEFHHDWRRHPSFEELRLDPLTGAAGRTLVDALLGSDRSLDELKRMLLERTGGVPLFVEEVVRSLVESGRLTGERGAYLLEGGGAAVEIPDGVRAVIASRIDRLPLEARDLLHVASVVGDEIPAGILFTIAEGEIPSAPEAMEVLLESDLLDERTGREVFFFRHNLIRDVAYTEISAGRRRQLHGKVVDALESLGPAEENLERLTVHAQLAERWEETAGHALAAAGRAEGRSSYVDAERFLTVALSALARLPRTRENMERMVDAHIAMRVARTGAGLRMSSVLDGLSEAEDLAEELDDVERMTHVSLHRSYVASTIGNHPVALSAAQKARALAGRLGSKQLEAEGLLAEAQARVISGRPGGVVEMLLPELDYFRTEMRRQHGMVGMRSTWCLMHLADAHALTGRFPAADRFGREAERVAGESGRPFDMAYAGWIRAAKALMAEQITRAVELFDRALDIARLHDLKWAAGWLGAFQGFALTLRGDLDGADEILEGVRRDTARMGAPMIEGWCLAHRARLAVKQGDTEAAAEMAERAIEIAVPWEQVTLEVNARRFAAMADRGSAERHLRTAVALARREGLVPFLAWALLDLGTVLGPESAEGRTLIDEANRLRSGMGLEVRRPARAG